MFVTLINIGVKVLERRATTADSSFFCHALTLTLTPTLPLPLLPQDKANRKATETDFFSQAGQEFEDDSKGRERVAGWVSSLPILSSLSLSFSLEGP